MHIFSITKSTKQRLYVENRVAKINDERSFTEAVLADFKELEEAGLTHPDIDKIKALLAAQTNTP